MKNNKEKTIFAQKLIQLRKEKGLSQRKLAELSHLTPRMIYYYENETNNPPIDRVKAIAKALDVDINNFLEIEKPTAVQNEFSKIDSRTIKKLKLILSLPKYERHTIYRMAEALLLKIKQESKT